MAWVAVNASPYSATDSSSCMVGLIYIRMPERVIGVVFMPAAKNISGTVVTTPDTGSSSHCQPERTPAAPVPWASIQKISTRAKGARVSVSTKVETAASERTCFFSAP